MASRDQNASQCRAKADLRDQKSGGTGSGERHPSSPEHTFPVGGFANRFEGLGSERPAKLCYGTRSREAAADEGKPGREAPFGESRHPVSAS